MSVWTTREPGKAVFKLTRRRHMYIGIGTLILILLIVLLVA